MLDYYYKKKFPLRNFTWHALRTWVGPCRMGRGGGKSQTWYLRPSNDPWMEGRRGGRHSTGFTTSLRIFSYRLHTSLPFLLPIFRSPLSPQKAGKRGQRPRRRRPPRWRWELTIKTRREPRVGEGRYGGRKGYLKQAQKEHSLQDAILCNLCGQCGHSIEWGTWILHKRLMCKT